MPGHVFYNLRIGIGNVIVFMEPPANGTSAALQVDFMGRLDARARAHVATNVNYLAAFVTGDTNAVRALVAKNRWDANRVAMVPGGLRNPHGVRLGIFLADERPNTFTVAHDGTITWSMSGMYQMAAGANGVMGTVGDKIQLHDLAVGQAALREGDLQKALSVFRDWMPDYRGKSQAVKNAQRQGLARAYKGLGDWSSAVKAFDAILADHTEAATVAPCACNSLARKLRARAEILEKLGRKAEADVDRKRAEHLACPRGGRPKFNSGRYEQGVFNKLQGFTYREDWQAAFAYIDDLIVHSKDGRQAERESLAIQLHERAEVLTHLGLQEKARQDEQWADALTRGIEESGGPREDDSRHPPRYVDVVHEQQ